MKRRRRPVMTKGELKAWLAEDPSPDDTQVVNRPEIIYVRVGLFIPWEYRAIQKPVFVPLLNRYSVASFSVPRAIDVTSVYDPPGAVRWHQPRFTTFEMSDGRRFHIPNELIIEGVAGGGWFVTCRLNPICDEPLTLEEFERRESAREDAEALEFAMDW